MLKKCDYSSPVGYGKTLIKSRICFVTGKLRPDKSGYGGIPCTLHFRHARQSLNSGGC